MKAILEFNDAWGDDAWGHKMALNGPRYHSALREIDDHCRSRLKYVALTKGQQDELEEIRKMIREAVPNLDDE